VKKAFSLIELLIVITLLGVMAILSFSYLNISTLSKQNIKTEFASHLNIITATILQCKDLSGSMPTAKYKNRVCFTLKYHNCNYFTM